MLTQRWLCKYMWKQQNCLEFALAERYMEKQNKTTTKKKKRRTLYTAKPVVLPILSIGRTRNRRPESWRTRSLVSQQWLTSMSCDLMVINWVSGWPVAWEEPWVLGVTGQFFCIEKNFCQKKFKAGFKRKVKDACFNLTVNWANGQGSPSLGLCVLACF